MKKPSWPLALLAALALTATVAVAPASANHRHRNTVEYSATPIDLQPGVDNPTDGVRAFVIVKQTRRGTTGRLIITGLPPRFEVNVHGHTGQCVAGQTGPHYQNQVGGPVDNVNEFWLSGTANKRGVLYSRTRVKWNPRPGEMPIIAVHDAADGNTQTLCFKLERIR